MGNTKGCFIWKIIFLKFNKRILIKKKDYEREVKILEDNLIGGLLTETNQFIMISQPTENIDDDLPVSENKNFTEVDNTILTSTEPTPRDEFINPFRSVLCIWACFGN